MPRVSIKCQNCCTRLDADLNDEDILKLGVHGLTRYCRQCAGNTRWLAHSGSATVQFSREAAQQIEGGKRLLLIDDDQEILSVLGKVLSGLHFELDRASTGRQAVQLLSRNDYDLILSDIRMPELDGQQLFEFLSQNMPEYKERVIFLTGDTGNPATMDFLVQSNCPYLSKPLEIPTLLQLLHQYFSA